MARRRGLGVAETMALSMANLTATGALVSVPCFVYTLDASLSVSTSTASFSIADTTAAADVVKESSRQSYVLGAGGAASFPDRLSRNFMPPLYVEKALYFANGTANINNVSVTYVAAS